MVFSFWKILFEFFWKNSKKAGNATQMRDILLGKKVFYLLNYPHNIWKEFQKNDFKIQLWLHCLNFWKFLLLRKLASRQSFSKHKEKNRLKQIKKEAWTKKMIYFVALHSQMPKFFAFCSGPQNVDIVLVRMITKTISRKRLKKNK